MEPRILNRRLAATAIRVAHAHEAARRDITDPKFNLREIAKQMILLEDHLAHPYKLCDDCIRKHLLTIEGLAEEASAMDKEGDSVALAESIAEKSRQWMEVLADGKPPREVSIEVRNIRKSLVPLIFDPRDAAVRVASIYVQRGRCRHR